jgi:hypothetical protein
MYRSALQISLSPGDLKLVDCLLIHQLKVWYPQVDKVYLICDTQKSKGRFGVGWDESFVNFKKTLVKIKNEYEKVEVIYVDYKKLDVIGNKYFLASNPRKDFRGGPFFSYFFALDEIPAKYILHIDSDIFFGGQSKSWYEEAISFLETNKDVLYVSPLPGPPREDEILIDQKCNPIPEHKHAHKFEYMSTRVFLLDKERLIQHLPLPLNRVSGSQLIKALIKRNPPFDLPENLLSQHMREKNLLRIDFLGKGKGMWTLHPPYKTEAFYTELPKLIEKIENNDIPELQKGFYDINDSMIDWSDARDKIKKNRWWKRLLITK